MNKKKILFIGLLIIFSFSIFASQTRIDSLETQLVDAKGEARTKILAGLVFEYRHNNPPKAVEYGKEALALLNDFKDEPQKAKLLNDLAWAYLQLNEFQIALDHAYNSLEITRKINDLSLQSGVLYHIGSIYFQQNDLVKALEQYILALEIQEEIQDSFEMARLNGNIGLIFFSTKDFNKSLEYLSKALKFYKEMNKKNSIASTSLNIAGIYQNLGDNEKALDHCLLALKFSEEIGNELLTGIILNNIAIIYYYNFNEPNKALEYFNRSLTITKKNDDKIAVASSLYSIGSIYKDLGLYEKALENEIEALEISLIVNDNMRIVDILKEISYIHSKMNNYKKSYEYIMQAVALKDSLYAVETEEKIAEIQTKYETEKKEQQIEILKKDNKIQNMTRNYFIGGFIFAFILAGILYNRYRIKSKANKELSIARTVAEEANLMKTELLGIAAHDLKNPLNSILGFSKLIKQEIPEHTTSSEFIDVIEESSEEMLSLINHLLNSSAIETGKITLEPVPVKFNDLAFSLISVMTSPASLKDQKIVYEENDTDIIVKADKGRLKEVMDNLISNAIKYSEYDKTIWVRLNKDKDKAIFEVEDEGPGLTDADKKKLFGRFQKLSARPTGGEGSTGLGLSIAKQLIELQDGTIEVESEPGKGSTFRIILPILEIEDISMLDDMKEEKAELETEEIIFEPATIVIADDIGENRKLIRNLLGNQEFTIFEAKNGKELVELVHKVKPGIIFTDVQMPEMDGYEATKKLKEDENYKEIPIIAVTASTLKTEESKAKAAGCDGFIRKPVSNESLMEELKKFIPPKETIKKEEEIEEKEIIELTEEVKARLPELLKILKDEMIEKCEKVKTNFVIGEIEDFGEKIRNLGEEYQIEFILKWADKLLAETQSFDIGKIQISLNKFSELIKYLNSVENKK